MEYREIIKENQFIEQRAELLKSIKAQLARKTAERHQIVSIKNSQEQRLFNLEQVKKDQQIKREQLYRNQTSLNSVHAQTGLQINQCQQSIKLRHEHIEQLEKLLKTRKSQISEQNSLIQGSSSKNTILVQNHQALKIRIKQTTLKNDRLKQSSDSENQQLIKMTKNVSILREKKEKLQNQLQKYKQQQLLQTKILEQQILKQQKNKKQIANQQIQAQEIELRLVQISQQNKIIAKQLIEFNYFKQKLQKTLKSNQQKLNNHRQQHQSKQKVLSEQKYTKKVSITQYLRKQSIWESLRFKVGLQIDYARHYSSVYISPVIQ